MKQPDDTVYLRHVLDAIAKVDRYLTNVDREMFLQDTLIQDGVVRQIQIIGEAVRRLSPAFRDDYPSDPWRDIARARGKMGDDYFGVDLETVYATGVNDLRSLEAQIRPILRELIGE